MDDLRRLTPLAVTQVSPPGKQMTGSDTRTSDTVDCAKILGVLGIFLPVDAPTDVFSYQYSVDVRIGVLLMLDEA